MQGILFMKKVVASICLMAFFLGGFSAHATNSCSDSAIAQTESAHQFRAIYKLNLAGNGTLAMQVSSGDQKKFTDILKNVVARKAAELNINGQEINLHYLAYCINTAEIPYETLRQKVLETVLSQEVYYY